MKLNRLTILKLFMIVLIFLFPRCEYDGPTAAYYQSHEQAASPTSINGLIPDKEAAAGVNYITIIGDNFSEVVENNKVYFDGSLTETTDASKTSITVRRPNQFGDSLTVKVVKYGALKIAEYKPYKIDSVYSAYGEFEEGDELRAVAIDENENVYVIQLSPRNVYKIKPDGEKTIIGNALRPVTDAKIGPGGNLILLMNNSRIYQIDVESGSRSTWVTLDNSVSFGDFDSNGYFYTGGEASDLVVVAPDLTFNPINLYSADTISCVRVYNDYVYLLVKLGNPDNSDPELAIWRHPILDASGSLGNRELVLNWAETGVFAESEVSTFTFSADGTIYIGTNYTQPIMSYNQQTGDQDIFYKNIIPSSAYRLVWGNGDRLYMLVGGEQWDLIRIDMGTLGAPYFGRNL